MLQRSLVFILFPILLSAAEAQSIHTVQHGDWEDPSVWSNNFVPDSLDGDTLFIEHYVVFNHDIVISNSYVQTNYHYGLCGHYSIQLKHSEVFNYGYMVSDYFLLDSSKWYCEGGHWNFPNGFDTINNSIIYFSENCWGDSDWQFICVLPDIPDTIVPTQPLSIQIYPSPAVNYFIITSQIPDTTFHVTLNIYDLLGRKIKTISIPAGESSLTIFTNGWAAGMYLLKFNQGEIILRTEKLIRVQ